MQLFYLYLYHPPCNRVPDMTPSRWTGLAVVSIACFWMVGSLYTAAVALAILHDVPTASDWQPDWGSDAPWRRFALACAVVPLAATVLVTCCLHEPAEAIAPITGVDSPPLTRVSSSSSLLRHGPAGGITSIVAAARSSVGVSVGRRQRGRSALARSLAYAGSHSPLLHAEAHPPARAVWAREERPH